jgi:hypothetical protein
VYSQAYTGRCTIRTLYLYAIRTHCTRRTNCTSSTTTTVNPEEKSVVSSVLEYSGHQCRFDKIINDVEVILHSHSDLSRHVHVLYNTPLTSNPSWEHPSPGWIPSPLPVASRYWRGSRATGALGHELVDPPGEATKPARSFNGGNLLELFWDHRKPFVTYRVFHFKHAGRFWSSEVWIL